MAHVEFMLAAVTVVLSLVWLLCRFVFARRTSRDLAWRTALVVVAIAPGLTVVRSACLSWQWPIRILPAASASGSRAEGAAVFVQQAIVESSPMNRADAKTATGAPGAPLDARPIVRNTTGRQAEPNWRASSDNASRTDSAASSDRKHAHSWLTVLASLWLVGSLFQCLRITRAARNSRRLISSIELVTDERLRELSAWSAQKVGLPHSVDLVISAHVGVPIVCGLWRARIVIPPCLAVRDALPQVRAALLHEYGHIRRRDLAFDLLLKLVVAGLWPHPLVHLMARELRRLREEICDNYVLAEESPAAYSELLLQLAVGRRFNNGELIGQAMFSKQSWLEARIDSILAPGRLLETRPLRWTRWLVAGATSVALFAAILIRLERAVAAPPFPDPATTSTSRLSGKPADVPKNNPLEQPQKTTAAITRQGNDDSQPPPREFLFQVVTRDGKPVVGATVTPWALSCSGGSFSVNDKQESVAKSDSNGTARVVFTKEMDVVTTAMLGHRGISGIDSIALRVDHPHHPVMANYIAVGRDQKIVLADSATIAIRARRAQEQAPALRLYPLLSRSAKLDWSEVNGLLTIRRVDLSSKLASQWLRVVQVPTDGPAWFSDLIDLKEKTGNSISLDVTLVPAVQMQGRLGDMVPRPVKNGRAIAVVVAGQDGSSTLAWNAVADIAADGTFILDSLPAHENLQIIALCDNWVSRSPSSGELKVYSAQHGFPGQDTTGGTAAGRVFPQSLRLNATVNKSIIPMELTASSAVTVLDEQGAPIANAEVQFFPNQVFHNYGSSLLGNRRDQAAFIRERLASRDRNQDADEPLPTGNEAAPEYLTKTDARGVAVVSGLPPAVGDGPQVFRQVQFSVGRPGYVAISNFRTDADEHFPILVAPLTAGKTERVTVRMRREDPLPEEAAVGADELTGRVVNEQGQPLADVQVLVWEQDEDKIRTDQEGRFHLGITAESGDEHHQVVRFIKPGYAPYLVSDWKLGRIRRDVVLETKTYFEGVVRRPDGQPAADVLIRANQGPKEDNPAAVISEIWTETRTDAAGKYKLLVQPDSYAVEIRVPGVGAARVPKAGEKSDDDDANSRALPKPVRPKIRIASHEAKTLDIQLTPGVEFRARIVDGATGKPIPGVRLWHWQYPGVEGRSDAMGLVTIATMPECEFTFMIESPGYLRGWSPEIPERWKELVTEGPRRGPASPTIAVDEGLPFDLTLDMPQVTITLEPCVKVTGHVRDPEGRPVAGATVAPVRSGKATSLTGDTRYSVATKDDGSFTVELPPDDGQKYNLTVHDGEYGQWRLWANGVGPVFEANAGQKIDALDLRLTRAGIVRGRVVDSLGKPVAKVYVQTTATDWLESNYYNPSIRSDDEGRFELRFVRPGRHLVHGWMRVRDSEKDGPKYRAVDVKPGEIANVGDVFIPPEDQDRP